MRIKRQRRFKIREGKHSPSLYQRLTQCFVFLLWTPKRIRITNVYIGFEARGFDWSYALHNDMLIDLILEQAQSLKDREWWLDQKNKIGGVAWGLPKWSKSFKRWVHPNSVRGSFTFGGKQWVYRYIDGKPHYALSEGLDFDLMRQHRSLVAYSLGSFIGGEFPAPCDIEISFDIEYIF